MQTSWSKWNPIPSPELCRSIVAPIGPGVYQIRNKKTNQFIQFGIGVRCQKRMKSLFPKPYGVGTRKNEKKRIYILENWTYLEYRTIPTATRVDAKHIEDELKLKHNHLFNT